MLQSLEYLQVDAPPTEEEHARRRYQRQTNVCALGVRFGEGARAVQRAETQQAQRGLAQHGMLGAAWHGMHALLGIPSNSVGPYSSPQGRAMQSGVPFNQKTQPLVKLHETLQAAEASGGSSTRRQQQMPGRPPTCRCACRGSAPGSASR